jgi:23S rRNA (uracil1939-C5)-methyltransferase
MAGGQSLDHVLDLYAGTSTLGILFSSIAKKVTSIEINPHAVFDAEVNKEKNQIENLTVKMGDVAEGLTELRKDPSFRSELVVVDPPRSGLDPKALAHLIELSPSKILYISCNPTTQAENVKFLLSHGYILTQVQPVDQFPHTIHVENICLLERVSL